MLRHHPLKWAGEIQISAPVALYASKPLQLIVFSERHRSHYQVKSNCSGDKLITSCMGIELNFHISLQRVHPLKVRNRYSGFVTLFICPVLHSCPVKALVL